MIETITATIIGITSKSFIVSSDPNLLEMNRATNDRLFIYIEQHKYGPMRGVKNKQGQEDFAIEKLNWSVQTMLMEPA